MAQLPEGMTPVILQQYLQDNKMDPQNPQHVSEAIEDYKAWKAENTGRATGMLKILPGARDLVVAGLKGARDMVTQAVGSALVAPGLEPTEAQGGLPDAQREGKIQTNQQEAGKAVVPQNAAELALLAAAPAMAATRMGVRTAPMMAARTGALTGIGAGAGATEAAVTGEDPMMGAAQGGVTGLLAAAGNEATNRLFGPTATRPVPAGQPAALAASEQRSRETWGQVVQAAADDVPLVGRLLNPADSGSLLRAAHPTGIRENAGRAMEAVEGQVRAIVGQDTKLQVPALGGRMSREERQVRQMIADQTGRSLDETFTIPWVSDIALESLQRRSIRPSGQFTYDEARREIQNLRLKGRPDAAGGRNTEAAQRASLAQDQLDGQLSAHGNSREVLDTGRREHRLAMEWQRMFEQMLAKKPKGSPTEGLLIDPDQIAGILTQNVAKRGTKSLPGPDSSIWRVVWESAAPGSRDALVDAVRADVGVRNALSDTLRFVSHYTPTRTLRAVTSLLSAAARPREEQVVQRIGSRGAIAGASARQRPLLSLIGTGISGEVYSP